MIAVRFEQIRPREFDDKFYRPFLVFAMADFGKKAVKEFNNVVRYWHSNRPKFKYTRSTTLEGKSKIAVDVTTDNPVFYFVDRGVDAHPIYPRKSSISGTSGTYNAGSLPGTLSVKSSGGNKPGNDGRYLNLNWVVPWPGIKARGWSELIREKLEGDFREDMQEALNKSAEKCWKGSNA